MRERLQDERRGFADHCRVDATGDRALRSRRPRRDWPLPNLVQRTHHTLYATGRTGRKFPETSPVQARMQSTDGTGRGGRVRGVADQLPRFLQNFAGRRRRPGRGSDGPQRAATRPVRSASVR